MGQITIPMRPVTSTQISQVGYDPATQTLAVQFAKGNSVYHYAGVSQGTFEDLLAAKSPGRFLQANVIGKFQFNKLNTGESDADSDKASR